jgi:hypothetical protein
MYNTASNCSTAAEMICSISMGALLCGYNYGRERESKRGRESESRSERERERGGGGSIYSSNRSLPQFICIAFQAPTTTHCFIRGAKKSK